MKNLQHIKRCTKLSRSGLDFPSTLAHIHRMLLYVMGPSLSPKFRESFQKPPPVCMLIHKGAFTCISMVYFHNKYSLIIMYKPIDTTYLYKRIWYSCLSSFLQCNIHVYLQTAFQHICSHRLNMYKTQESRCFIKPAVGLQNPSCIANCKGCIYVLMECLLKNSSWQHWRNGRGRKISQNSNRLR